MPREIRFDRRMSDSDALMWAIEKDPLLRSTITGVAVLDRPLDRDRFEEQLERASRVVPRLRQRVLSSPFNVAPPEFAIDPNFDLRYHVRHVRAPGDGSLRALLDMAAPLAMQGFDRARPLWEFVVVDGLQDGRAALLQKMHHALTDGVGAMKISMAFLDTERVPTRDPGPMPPAPEPEPRNAPASVLGGLAHVYRRQMGIARRLPGELLGAARHPLGTARAVVDGTASAARLLRPVSAPLSPVMDSRSLSVRFDTISASLPAMKAAAKAADGRLNDAFVAAVAGGLDRYHRRHGVSVERLRMTMPINIRPAEGALVAGNQFVPARFVFPVGIDDPVERMVALRDLLREQRAEPALGFVAPISGVLNRLPVSVSTAVFGSMLKAIDVVTSNVPGAPMPIYIAGARLEANYGFGPLCGAGTNITLLSYIDDLHIGISTDPAAVPDPDVFVESLQEGFDEVEKLAGGR
jgi:WS/DGAT/MGAT family acyltransferase